MSVLAKRINLNTSADLMCAILLYSILYVYVYIPSEHSSHSQYVYMMKPRRSAATRFYIMDNVNVCCIRNFAVLVHDIHVSRTIRYRAQYLFLCVYMYVAVGKLFQALGFCSEGHTHRSHPSSTRHPYLTTHPPNT